MRARAYPGTFVTKQVFSGAVSMVYLCRKKSTQQVHAVKVINKALCVKKNSLRDEITVLLRVKHPHIISLEEVYESDNDLLLVMERYRARFLESLDLNRFLSQSYWRRII